jgi:hypothetical protein
VYVALGNTTASDNDSGPAVCGVFYRLSPDLVHWSRPQLIARQARPMFTGSSSCPDVPAGSSQAGAGAYATVIDHDSNAINFDTAGQSPFIYSMKLTSATNSNVRNLVRRPLIFIKGPGFTGDVSAPNMNLEVPTSGQTLSGGVSQVVGWAFDDVRVARVDILVDGRLIGNASLGVSRADVARAFPGAPSDAGFIYSSSIPLSSGTHTVTARAFDSTGNSAERSVTVTIS